MPRAPREYSSLEISRQIADQKRRTKFEETRNGVDLLADKQDKELVGTDLKSGEDW